ncbi:glycoside hydrolase family 127 protein [Stakelama sediminis]
MLAVSAGFPEMAAKAAEARILPGAAAALPMDTVRLRPSAYLDAVNANRTYLMRLEPDRLLHNYRRFAGLKPKGALYGGWESETIAGEALGHYLSALALLHAQTGDTEAVTRIDYILAQMDEVQQAQGDGYVAGFMRKRKDGTIVDGKEIFPEIMAGEIRSTGFDLNGAWSPFYNLHKVFAGLLDVHKHVGRKQALEIAVKFGAYIDHVTGGLTPAQMQEVLACEFGGINESFADMYARTGDPRWKRLSERFYHKAVLDPLTARKDILPNLHSNTQIPKVIGVARYHEATGDARAGIAPRFFWDTVVHHHSFVIGGNGDREYFFEPDAIAQHITEQTCEGCSSYNMLKLSRHIFAWQPDGAVFDYYERTHLNHILAQQNPATSMFTYMTPMMSGTKRDWSSPFNDFWCCVCTGMESHSKHGDSIFWEGKGGDTFFVNLFIPATAHWRAQDADFTLDTRYPYDGAVSLTASRIGSRKPFAIALRIPAWAPQTKVLVNGKPASMLRNKGYAVIRRSWRTGDVVTMDIPLDLRLEPTQGNDEVIAALRGPMVLAADLGPADKDWEGDAPALVGSDLTGAFQSVSTAEVSYRTQGIGRPADMTFTPFYGHYERRSAVYFRRFTDAGWAKAQIAYRAEQERLRDLAARSVDVMHLGEMQAERDHKLQADISYPVVYRGRNGRDARSGGYFEFTMKVRPGPLVLEATYWGGERKRKFHILIDGTPIATQTLEADKPGEFFDVDYPIPEKLTRGKQSVQVKFVPEPDKTAGPVFGVRIFTPKKPDDRQV